jgi:cysteinyl-tRNA synthetase
MSAFAMSLHLYNTLSRRKEAFEPGDPHRVTMYVCGPTVYNYAHIGNARPYVVFDVLARLLRRRYTLVYARNLTDVDDKINAAARREGVDIGVLTARYIQAFHEDMSALGIEPPDVEPRVTEHIPEIIGVIQRLVENGHAYEAEGHVLFSVASYAGYGGLSRRSLEDMIAGARVDVAPYKRDPADFVLWKPSEADVVGWDSPWGRGRPGWHIECSAMVETHLGETIDIHGGGQDLVFPHHENETAQSTCAHDGRLFCRYWLHNGLVNMGTEKMSKSVGNILLVRELLARADGEVVRLSLLTAHYRQPLEWTDQLVEESKHKLDRMYGALRDAGVEASGDDAAYGDPPPAVLAALEDDLNTPQALTELLGLARAANKAAEPLEKAALGRSLRAGAHLLGLLSKHPAAWFEGVGHDAEAGALGEIEIDVLLERREALRRERKFAEADAIRATLAEHGIVIEDVAGGSRWRRAH